jgi:hypothetical protein
MGRKIDKTRGLSHKIMINIKSVKVRYKTAMVTHATGEQMKGTFTITPSP